MWRHERSWLDRAGLAEAVAVPPVALAVAVAPTPFATEPGAQAAAMTPTDVMPSKARTSRRDRTRPINRSSSSGSDGRVDGVPAGGRMSASVGVWFGVIGRAPSVSDGRSSGASVRWA
jgi:hypothetical protein